MINSVIFLIVVLLAISQSNIVVSYVDTSDIIMPTEEIQWNCRASSFLQYVDSCIVGATYPEDCTTPGLNVFKSLDVIYIEEAKSFDEYLVKGEMNVTETDSMISILNSYESRNSSINLLCWSNSYSSCPEGFSVVSNITLVDFEMKTVLYRPIQSLSNSMDEVISLAGDSNILGIIVISKDNHYSGVEIVDMNIIFAVAILLVIVMAATVYVVATIDYGKDDAGLYSKFKQIKSQ